MARVGSNLAMGRPHGISQEMPWELRASRLPEWNVRQRYFPLSREHGRWMNIDELRHLSIYRPVLSCPVLSYPILSILSIYLSIHPSIHRSIYLSTYLPIYLSTYLPIYLSTYLPIYLSTYLPIYLSIYLSTYLPIYLSTYLPIYLSTYLPIYLSTYLPIYLSIYLSTYLPIYLSHSFIFTHFLLAASKFGGLPTLEWGYFLMTPRNGWSPNSFAPVDFTALNTWTKQP